MNSRLFNFSTNFKHRLNLKRQFNSFNIKNFSVLSNRKAETSVIILFYFRV